MRNSAIKLVILLLTALPLALQAQNVTVGGTVVDGSSQPLPGVSVVEEGTMNGMSTDLDGHYRLTVKSASSRVIISCIGFKTQTFAAGDLARISTVVLEEDTEMMEEVVVIGYGGVKKEDLTGSVSVVSAEEINRGSVADSYELLRGKSPGVQIIPGNGAPGSGATIRIRGAASLNASNNPLIVVDGVTLAQNDMSMINPDDIKSFTILKDASATAIYGSRASNGVILITTKKGSGRGIKVAYNGSYSVNQNTATLDMMSADEFKSFLRERYPNNAEAVIGDASTDWQKEVTRLGQTTTHTLSISGNNRTETLPWRVSGGYTYQGGTLVASYFNRGNLSASVAPSLLDKHLNIQLSFNGGITDSYNANVLSPAASFNPTMPVHWLNPDGSIDYTTTNGWFNYGTGRGKEFIPNPQVSYQNAQNPLGSAYDNHHAGPTFRTVSNAKVQYKIHGFEDLALNATLAYENNFGKRTNGANIGSFSAVSSTDAPWIGTYSFREWNRTNTLFEAYANYNHDFSGHRVDAMAGYTWNRVFNHSYNETRFNDAYNEYKKDDVFGNPTTDDQEYVLLSFYGRLNYSYKGRYLVTFTLRDDASSRFSPKTRWGLFPSVALAWNLAEEKFIKDLDVFSQLKIRTGWGVTGQQEIGQNYPYIARYKITTSVTDLYDMGSSGYAFQLSPLAYDPNIKWEETTTRNIGFDMGILGDRFTASFDYYNRDTKDLLNNVSIPLGANFNNTLLTNIGSINNRGFEMAFSWTPVSTRDWNVNIGLNGTFQKTVFTKLTNTDDPDYGIQIGQIAATKEGYLELHKVGYAPYMFYCYQQLYDENGNPIQNAAVDRNGDGAITDADRYMTGKKPSPDFFGGISFKASYKNWDFGFNGHGSIGNYLFNDVYGFSSTSATDFGFGFIPNYNRYVLQNNWRVANEPRQSFSDMFLEDASFFRMDDINLGYSLRPRNSRMSYRFAFSVQNAFVITNYTGMDPEAIDEKGIDTQTLGSTMSNIIFWPRPRVYSFRVSINFN